VPNEGAEASARRGVSFVGWRIVPFFGAMKTLSGANAQSAEHSAWRTLKA
jgi:hypothetical protein